MRLNIRWRLTLWNTFALAVLLIGFAVLVYTLLRQALYAGVDRGLTDCLRQLEREPRIAIEPARLRYWVDEFWEHEHVACVVYDVSGKVEVRTEELAADSVPAAPNSAMVEPKLASIELPIIGRQRVLAIPLPHDSHQRSVVLLASLSDTDRTLGQLRNVLLAAVPGMLLVAACIAYLLAGRALAPVRIISRATRSISADALNSRLPVVNPHDELGQLSTTINDMIARLERSFAEIKRFTADASHELRTPLTVLRTEVELALGSTLTQEETKALLGSVLEECQRLTNLTDQLLTLARQDAGQPMLPEGVPVAELVAAVVETLQPLAEAKNLTMTFDAGGAVGRDVVTGDPDQLRQVFVNVLDNAIKYTAAGQVTVNVKSTSGQVVSRVQDTGEGISPEHVPRVFDRFYRVNKARSREQGGTGLGLSIARSIVEAHGGQIDLSSLPGKGTVCTITLPARSEPTEP